MRLLRRLPLHIRYQPHSMSLSTIPHSRSPTPTDDFPPKRRKMASPHITLSAQEETVRRLLVDVGAEIDTIARTTGANKEPIVLRFAGGWVRDKLLGIQSHDIDVGINRMTGFDFGMYLADFLRRHIHAYNIPPEGVHKIESNPERSKHLETATTKILGLDIDLVNLRSESYTDDSRIPQMEFGTPVQDALRRDCTVNALFYNLHSQQVEDFTGYGLQDLADKLIRTPLAPYDTFNDDPLRVLRLIRFSSRLDFTIVPAAKSAMQHPDIQTALRLKISRERIGTEIEKILTGTNPSNALLQIHTLNLYTTIFTLPTNDPPPTLTTSTLPLAVAALTKALSSSLSSLITTPHERYLAWLIAALTPWSSVPPSSTPKPIPAAATATREGLKATNKIFDTVARTYTNAALITGSVNGAEEWSRSAMGSFVKRLGADWRSQVMGAAVLEMVRGEEDVVGRYERFVRRVREMRLEGAYNDKSIVDGTTMCTLYGLKPGSWCSSALRKALEWQWDHPGVEKEEAVEWVKANREKLAPEEVGVGVGVGK